MKCPECDGTGKVVHPMMTMNGDEYTGEWEQHECEMCGGTGEIQQTNEEWFCQLSTEEKVSALVDMAHQIKARMKGEIGSYNKFEEGGYFREWLKEAHK